MIASLHSALRVDGIRRVDRSTGSIPEGGRYNLGVRPPRKSACTLVLFFLAAHRW